MRQHLYWMIFFALALAASAPASAAASHGQFLPLLRQRAPLEPPASVWRWQNPAPQAWPALRAVVAADAATGWAAANDGSVLKTTDGGATWTPQSYGAPRYLTALAAASRLDAWVTGADGSVLATTDGGATWTEQLPPQGVGLTALVAGSPAAVWAVGRGGAILGARPP